MAICDQTARPAPKIGLVINSIGVFNAAAKDRSERPRPLPIDWPRRAST